MALLFHGDCLEEMKQLDDNSVDFIFCDLPYGQTSCKWDIKIDMVTFWEQIMRVKKLHTPIFFTTTTKFGVDLIRSAPKKCPFRYDLVWVKSAPAGFLSAKKMPMRKHEMIYVFYEKLPLYDLSSHKHKFLNSKNGMKGQDNLCYGSEVKQVQNKKYDPPLPVSVVNEKYTYKQDKEKDLYGTDIRKEVRKGKDVGKSPIYDPPLPNSMLEIKSTRGKHSTEKPVALMEWLLKYYSKEGDVVLDPTMGSGSTGIACKNMNRNFIGIEMNDEYYELCCNRLYE